MQRRINGIVSASLLALALAVPVGAAAAPADVDAAWNVRCRSGTASTADCGVVRGVVDAGDPGHWVDVALQFDEAGGLHLVVKTFPLSMPGEGLAVLVDGRQIGALKVDGCGDRACDAAATLPKTQASRLLRGEEVEFQIPLGADTGVRLPVSTRGVQTAIASLRGTVAASMPTPRRADFEAATAWTASDRASAVFFVADDHARAGGSESAAMMRKGATTPTSCGDGRPRSVVVAARVGGALSRDEVTTLDALRAAAKACDGKVLVIMHPADADPAGAVSSTTLEGYIEGHGITSALGR